MRTRVALAEDHSLVRQRLRKILVAESGIDVVGEAKDGREALRQAFELAPDVVVMDIRMPLLNGIEATRAIRGGIERVQVLVLSLHCDAALARQSLDAGARGVMLKEEAHQLVKATLLVAGGTTYLSPKILGFLQGNEPATVGRAAGERLSPGERDVLRLFAAGASGPEITCQLRVDAQALEGHRRGILRKLSPHGASDLARLLRAD